MKKDFKLYQDLNKELWPFPVYFSAYAVCVHVCVHGACRCMGRLRSTLGVFFHISFWGRVSHWTCSSPSQLDWLSSTPQEPSCPYVPSTWITSKDCPFPSGAGDKIRIQVLMFAWHQLYQLNYLPAWAMIFCEKQKSQKCWLLCKSI